MRRKDFRACTEKSGADLRRAAALLLALLLLCGCAAGAGEAPASEAEPVVTAAATPEEDASRLAAWQADYALLWDELERSYPYLPYLASTGLDPDAIRESFAAELPTLRDDAAFAGLVQRLCRALRNFAHLDLVTPELYQSYYYAFVSGGAVTGPEAEAFAAVLQDPRLAERYRPPAEKETYRKSRAEDFPEVEITYDKELRALIFKIPSFAQETVERDRSLVPDALAQYPEAEHLVFDISANSGGSDWYWMNDLVSPLGGVYEMSYRDYFKGSDTVLRFYGLDSAPVGELDRQPQWVKELGLDRCWTSTPRLPDEDYDGPSVSCGAKRWVLIDSRVYSASDKFAAFCKASGWATLVGRRSSGDGLGATPILLLLPNTGLLLRFSAVVGENPDGSMNAARGTAPDEFCLPGQTPLARCLELIRDGDAS